MTIKTFKKLSTVILTFTLLTSCGSKGLRISEDEEIKFVQRESKIIKGSEGDIEIYIGDVTMGSSQIKIKGIDNNKIYFDRELRAGEEGYFQYCESKFYRLKVNKFENHLLHDDLAFIAIREIDEKVGKENASPITENKSHRLDPDETRKIFEKVKNSKLKFIRNGEILDDTTMADHLESKFLINKEDITSKEEFNDRIIKKSMTSGETYKVIKGKDTISLIDWIEGN